MHVFHEFTCDCCEERLYPQLTTLIATELSLGMSNYDSNSLSMKLMLWRSVDGLVLFVYLRLVVLPLEKYCANNVGYRFNLPPLSRS